MSEGTPAPARLAAVDQELAHLDDRLNRSVRDTLRGSAALAALAAAIVIALAVARPVVYWWELAVVMATLVLAVAGIFVQGVVLRGYRAEIRELRARVG